MSLGFLKDGTPCRATGPSLYMKAKVIRFTNFDAQIAPARNTDSRYIAMGLDAPKQKIQAEGALSEDKLGQVPIRMASTNIAVCLSTANGSATATTLPSTSGC
jgi:hypothetical protein